MPDVLFVNHRKRPCGVGEMGARYYQNLAESKRYNFWYIDVDERAEFEYWLDQIAPAAVVYNFYPSTLWWLSNELINRLRPRCKQIGIYHEVDIRDKGFDLIVHQDPNPSEKDDFPHWSLPRSIPRYTPNPPHFDGEMPRFGSFGFGLGGKGFARLVRQVAQEYDVARIHLHIPFAHFGDAGGVAAHAHADEAMKEAEGKPGIFLTVDHDWWSEDRLLEWLAGNTCNAFLYDEHYGRGISGTLDYALAVRRPLAITRSWQFRHVWGVDDSFCIENASLRQIVERGTAPTDKFRTMWSREAFVASFETALESLGV